HDFTVTYAGPCAALPLPPDELARARPRYVRWCESDRGRPGLTHAAQELEECATSREATSNCYDIPPGCKYVHGDLPARAPCGGPDQCASGWCGVPAVEAGAPVPACGTCAPSIPVGQTCNPRNLAAGACSGDDVQCTTSADASTCQPRMVAELGQACNPVPCN